MRELWRRVFPNAAGMARVFHLIAVLYRELSMIATPKTCPRFPKE
jgi:hypothetical protein